MLRCLCQISTFVFPNGSLTCEDQEYNNRVLVRVVRKDVDEVSAIFAVNVNCTSKNNWNFQFWANGVPPPAKPDHRTGPVQPNQQKQANGIRPAELHQKNQTSKPGPAKLDQCNQKQRKGTSSTTRTAQPDQNNQTWLRQSDCTCLVSLV